MLSELKHTHRRFRYYEFEDRNGHKCTLQKSSVVPASSLLAVSQRRKSVDNFIVILKTGVALHGSGYTAMLRRLEAEGKVEKIINISNPTEPRIHDKSLGKWIKLHVIG